MSGQIASDSKIIDIVHILPDPIEYLTGVVGNFVSHGYNPETSAVRIGIKGYGSFPNYKIEEPSGSFTINVPLANGHIFTHEMRHTPHRTFSGRNHREMRELEDRERHDENWSADTSNFSELKALLGSLWQSGGSH
jgi:hypothetical protein